MGKHCTEELAVCIAACVAKYGDSWTATFCTLDCELTYACCVIRDFSRALQGEDLAQASQVATKMESVARAYQEAATSIRAKVAVGFASNWNVEKKSGQFEPFYPDLKLLPSLVAAGAEPSTARAVTDKVIQEFRDGESTADIRAAATMALESINPELAAKYAGERQDIGQEPPKCCSDS